MHREDFALENVHWDLAQKLNEQLSISDSLKLLKAKEKIQSTLPVKNVKQFFQNVDFKVNFAL
jgi:hypothetical protein